VPPPQMEMESLTHYQRLLLPIRKGILSPSPCGRQCLGDSIPSLLGYGIPYYLIGAAISNWEEGTALPPFTLP